MQPAPRARAVAAAPVDALLARADELARRWAIALILALPLERIGEFPLESFARQAPLLCAHVVRALQSDADLERIASRSEEHTSELQSQSNLVCRLLLEKKKTHTTRSISRP